MSTLLVIVAGLLLGLAPLAWAQPSTQPTGGMRFNALADVAVGATAVQLGASANTDRVALVCTNNDATNGVRIGGSGTSGSATPTTTRGVRLVAGATISITARTVINAISESGTITVSCSEELR